MLDAVCRKDKDPLERIHEYFLRLHQAKLDKILHDPEIYRAFDLASESRKPFVAEHLKTVNRQLTGLVKDAIAARRLRKEPPERHVSVLLAATKDFVHPRLVAEHAHEKREALLRRTLEAVLAGLA